MGTDEKAHHRNTNGVQMTKHIIVYVVLGLLCALAYPCGRFVMIQQGPSGSLAASNLTINYILLFVLVGTASPWLATRLKLPKKFLGLPASILVTIVLVVILLVIFALVGVTMRFTQ